MNAGRFRGAALAMAGVILAAAGFSWWQQAAAERELATVAQEREALHGQLASLETRLEAQQKRARVVEDDNARLLQVIANRAADRAAAKPAWEPISHASVDARMKRAQAQMERGEPAAALQEYLWCFDTGFPLLNNTGGQALNAIVKLGENFSPAIEALRERREQAAQRILTGLAVLDDAMEFDQLNRALKEKERTIAFYDGLPRDDPRRREMGRVVFEPLVEVRRYRDALEALPYEEMLQIAKPAARLVQSQDTGTEEQRAARAKAQEAQRAAIARIIASETSPPLDEAQTAARVAQQKLAAERATEAMRNAMIVPTSKNIEVLAGAGEIERARELLEKVLAFDRSEATQTRLRKHLERAGHPELLK